MRAHYGDGTLNTGNINRKDGTLRQCALLSTHLGQTLLQRVVREELT